MKIILVALVFNGLDLVTGIIGAIRDGEQIKSSKLRDGLFKKVGFIFCYALGIAINYAESYLTFTFSFPTISPMYPISVSEISTLPWAFNTLPLSSK